MNTLSNGLSGLSTGALLILGVFFLVMAGALIDAVLRYVSVKADSGVSGDSVEREAVEAQAFSGELSAVEPQAFREIPEGGDLSAMAEHDLPENRVMEPELGSQHQVSTAAAKTNTVAHLEDYPSLSIQEQAALGIDPF